MKKHLSFRWWDSIRRRYYQLRLRQPEGTASGRHQHMDKKKVAKYFTILNDLIHSNS